ncbi:MAG TPA: GtrA family protein [Candidatus Nanoarchaeia archaeon]|nr:GtrA family protein [Candidatus Nanoarchaeia archaeon]
MKRIFNALEVFFGRFVPRPLKRLYAIGFRYGVFIFGGLIGYIIFYGTQRILYNAGMWRGTGLAVGEILAVLFTFMYHRHVTFDQKSNARERFLKFFPVQISLAVITWALSLVAIEHLHYPDLQATFVIVFLLSMVNFTANRLFVFRKH